jgi:hypothetical protein
VSSVLENSVFCTVFRPKGIRQRVGGGNYMKEALQFVAVNKNCYGYLLHFLV